MYIYIACTSSPFVAHTFHILTVDSHGDFFEGASTHELKTNAYV